LKVNNEIESPGENFITDERASHPLIEEADDEDTDSPLKRMPSQNDG
jgi:hypothetical protein